MRNGRSGRPERPAAGGAARICLVAGALGVGAVAGAAAAEQARGRASAPPPPAPVVPGREVIDPSALLVRETVTVTAVDRARGAVTVRDAEGESETIRVLPDVAAVDELAAGDRLDLAYYEAAALSLSLAGSEKAPGRAPASDPGRGPAGAPADREGAVTMRAEVISVDLRGRKLTVRGPAGETRTVRVRHREDDGLLPKLRPGQQVVLTYEEALAVSIEPRPAAPAR
jgi:hypothetical protein